LVDRRGLHRGDFVLAEAFTYNIEASGEGSITEGAIALAREGRSNSRRYTHYSQGMEFFNLIAVPLLSRS
jgi:hypothetical protein